MKIDAAFGFKLFNVMITMIIAEICLVYDPLYSCIIFLCIYFPVSLIGVDVGNASTRISRFANYLRNLLPSSDVLAMEMTAKAVGILALSSGTYAAEYVEFEVKRALEWLTEDRQEGKRHAAVSVLEEMF